ncbi:MAG: hypothetical protein ACFFDN_05175 [Candidatus Hodarchaeota archaeon]
MSKEILYASVLIQSARRCCICYRLYGDFNEKKGQIAHLDQNRNNNKLSNLVFLCLEHHDEYDTSTSQSKGFMKNEIVEYRKFLYEKVRNDLRDTDIKRIGYEPSKDMDYNTREYTKNIARKLMEVGDDSEKITGALLLIEAYYHRNQNAPSFETYVSHYIYANKNNFPNNIYNELIKVYGIPKYPMIKTNYSDWGSIHYK